VSIMRFSGQTRWREFLGPAPRRTFVLLGIDMVVRAWEFLTALPEGSFITVFWLTIVAEVPRYFVGVQATAAAVLLRDDRPRGPLKHVPSVSILLVGHNEEGSIESCVRSLHNQTFNRFEIICVDDGSNDQTFAIMRRLRRDGLIHTAVRLELRGSKPSGINLAARLARGDILVVIDCDCSFEPDAIQELLRPIVEQASVAAVSGNILVRNWRRSIISSLQAIEYLLSISLGKSYANILDQVWCVSGAFGAFRRDAWERVSGIDTGGGEDFDFTIRLRLAGYKVVFARHSICYTDVPETLYALLRQRHRWERDTFWVRLRKYKRLLNPFRTSLSWNDVILQWDFLLFNFLPTVIFPFYLVWLLTRYGEFGVLLLVAVTLVLFVLDLAVFACAVLVTGRAVYWQLLAFLPLFGPFQSYVMRLDRFYAYATEWVFTLSKQDNYTPQKTRDWLVWK
jgi:cellulose synthase/poly-beta-1,6-N-acetylglucosamine synthase-like glycosyltransferase